MKTTKELARELGLLRKRSISSLTGDVSKKQRIAAGQVFSYLVVLDFESTCWQDGKYRTQEIIEFPAVLCNTRTGEIESEFHYYVQPQEQPVLSEFCRQLTGITQAQVEQGIPLSLCLRKFTHWLNHIKQQKDIVFDEAQGNRAAFVTWSDWDLGVCLLYEARRKQLTRPPEVNSWVDLQATYRKFYGRKPQGLNGALQDVGIEFEGREHSGVDDARNTARLAWRMMRDGCIINITKNIAKGGENGQVTGSGGVTVYCDNGTSVTTTGVVLRQSKLPVKINNNSAKSCTKSKGLGIQDTNIISTEKSEQSKKQGKILNRTVEKENQKGTTSHTTIKQTHELCKGNSARTPVNSPMCDATRTPDQHQQTPLLQANMDKSVFKTPLGSNSKCLNVRSTNKTSQSCVLKPTSVHLSNSDKPVGSNCSKTPNSFVLCPGSKLRTPNMKSTSSVLKTPSPSVSSSSSSMRATPPMCKCGRRSKRRMVQSPGPNIGRLFFTCGVRASQYDKNRGCEFFQWETPQTGGSNSVRHVSKIGRHSLTKPFTPVLNLNSSATSSQSKRQLGVRTAVPKFIR